MQTFFEIFLCPITKTAIKNDMNCIPHLFSLITFAIYISFWGLYHSVVIIAKLWQSYPIYSVPIVEVILFIFISVKEGIQQSIALFWKNVFLILYSFLSISSFNTLNIFNMRLDIPYESSRCLIFVTHSDSLLASSSLKALRKKHYSFTRGILCEYLNSCVLMLILKINNLVLPILFNCSCFFNYRKT